jgi:hypothetical protein
MSITFKLESITPSKAKKMMEKSSESKFVNRAPTNSFISRYAGDMEKGHWQPNTGETIKVTTDGIVIDGNHRLHAIVQSGVTVKVWVCRGIDPAMFQYIDQGNTRDLKDIMSIEGWECPTILAVTGKMLWREDRSGNPYAHAASFNESDGNIYNWILTMKPDLRREWSSYSELIRKAYSSTMRSVPESLLFYLLYQWKKIDSDRAHLLIGYLSEGPAAIPPHNAIAFFKQYAIEVRAAQKDGKMGGNGRHADLKELLLKAADYTWETVTSGKKSVTYNGFKSGLGQYSAKRAAESIAA